MNNEMIKTIYITDDNLEIISVEKRITILGITIYRFIHV